ncbi:MAG: hypothetical protein FWH51_02290 [Dehalococcoidia bacterium]|nr:hypothetical protein [Dehalococcoidia bacterium]
MPTGNGIIARNKSHLLLNTDKIAEEEKLDGYYCLITSELDDKKPIVTTEKI